MSIIEETEQTFGFPNVSKFEEKLIANLLSDTKFLFQVSDILKPEFFDKSHLSLIAEFILDYFKEYFSCPTYEYFLIKLTETGDLYDEAVLEALIDFISNFYESKFQKQILLSDKEIIQKRAHKFCSTKSYINAIEVCVDLIGTPKEFEINNIIQKATIDTNKKNIRVDYDDLERRKKDKPRTNIVPLPFDYLNRVIGGGIGAGEVMAMIGPMGAGKSTLAQTVALHAKSKGFNVAFYTLELSAEFTRQKMDTILLGKEIKDINEFLPDIDKKNKEFSGKVFITRLPAGSTIFDIKNDIRQIQSLGHGIDLVIIDYIDLMSSIYVHYNKQDEWVKFGQLTIELRDELAMPEQFGIVALCQGNTSSIYERLITAQSAGGGAKRLFPADLVCGYARPSELKALEKANFSIIKSRFGKDSIYFECDTDYSVGRIEINKPYKLFTEVDEEIKEEIKDFALNEFIPKKMNLLNENKNNKTITINGNKN